MSGLLVWAKAAVEAPEVELVSEEFAKVHTLFTYQLRGVHNMRRCLVARSPTETGIYGTRNSPHGLPPNHNRNVLFLISYICIS